MPAAPTFGDGWRLGAPDLVIQMPQAFDVSAAAALLFAERRVL